MRISNKVVHDKIPENPLTSYMVKPLYHIPDYGSFDNGAFGNASYYKPVDGIRPCFDVPLQLPRIDVR